VRAQPAENARLRRLARRLLIAAHMKIHPSSYWLPLLASLAACQGTRTAGQLGHVDFSWNECFDGCPLDGHPMASGGASASIALTIAAGLHVSAVRSSDPGVAAFTLPGNSGLVDVQSGHAGQAQLQLLDGGGALVDQATVTVTDTATLGIQRGWSGARPVVLAGATEIFHVTTLDAHQQTLIGTGAVRFTLNAPLTKALAVFFGDGIGFTGTPGVGSAVATSAAAKSTLEVEVVDANAVDGITLAKAGAVVSDVVTSRQDVTIVARRGADAVYGADCAWTFSDGSASAQSMAVNGLEQPAQAQSRITFTNSPLTATCTIGHTTQTITISR
jgi:hypothetical protein